MNKLKYTLQIGLNVNNEPKYDYDFVYKMIDELTKEYGIDGYTLTECTGYYKSIKEQSLKVEIVRDDDIDFIIIRMIEDIKTIMEQECVMLEREVKNVEFM